MKTTKYEIEMPTVPDGFEVVGQGIAQAGDMAMRYTVQNGWHWCAANEFSPFNILARRKRTLADWANEQPLFKAFAEMRSNVDFPTRIEHHKGETWLGLGSTWNIATPPNGMTGNLTLKNGKWEYAT